MKLPEPQLWRLSRTLIFPASRHKRKHSLEQISTFEAMRSHDEIIEDSEPEREAMRQKERQERRKLRKYRKNEKAPAYQIVPVNVIEITDDEFKSSSTTSPPGTAEQSLAAVQTNSSRVLQHRGPYPRAQSSWFRSDEPNVLVRGNIQQLPLTSYPNHFGLPKSLRESVRESLAHIQETPPTELTTMVNEAQAHLPQELIEPTSDIGKTEIQTKLAGFAYPAFTLALSKRSIPRTRSASPSESGNTAPPKKKPSPTSGHRFTDFTDAELGKILKCVGCDTCWTTRKTVAQKMKHIQSCAKKHALSDSTVRVLIRKVLGETQPAIPQVDAIDPTFFEEAVLDAGRKKKARKIQIKETVQEVGTTRDYILDRARDVLGGQPETEDLDFPIYTQAFGQNKFGPTELTQAFGASVLAQKQKVKTAPAVSKYESNGEAPPTPTQPFGRSKLGDTFRSRTPPTDNHRGSNRTILTPIPNESRRPRMEADIKFTSPSIKAPSSFHQTPLPFDRANISAREVSPAALGHQLLPPQHPAFSLPTHRAEHPSAGMISASNYSNHLQGDEFYESDDTYIHYEPPIHPTYLFSHHGRDISHNDKTTNKRQPLGDIHSLHKPSTSKVTKTSPRKRKTETKEMLSTAEFDDSWEKRMTENIREDTNLYLRILRYEPVHFNEFLKVAAAVAGLQPAGKLKSKLRLFLDKQAIHFYGAEPIGRRS